MQAETRTATAVRRNLSLLIGVSEKVKGKDFGARKRSDVGHDEQPFGWPLHERVRSHDTVAG